MPELDRGTDELNVAEFPLSILGERPADVKTIEFCDTVFDQGGKREVTRKLTVTGSDRYGLPSAADEDVLVALMYLTKAARFESRTVNFSRYQLIQILGWPDKGQSYDRLEESLNRWLGVTLYYENAWWDKKAQTWVDRNFHILSELTIYSGRHRKPGMELPLSLFTWNETIFASFLARNIKSLDLDFYFRLDLAPAKRMYRFLDKRFGAKRGSVWRFDLREFACEHIGFGRNYDSAQLKRKMRPSILELEEKGFLEPMGEDKRYPKGAKRGEWSVVFAKRAELPAPAERKPLPSPLAAELTARGVTAKTAAELVASFPAERIAAKLDVFDWLREGGEKTLAKNPAGYLVKSIRDDFQPPAGYLPKPEREAKRQAGETAKKEHQEKKATAKKEEAAKKRALEAEREHISRFLDSLLPETREAFEARAIEQATPEERERLRMGDAIASMQRRLLIDRQVLKEHPLPASTILATAPQESAA
jgi:hypothetical protein